MSLQREFEELDGQINRLLTGTERKIAREYAGLLRELRSKLGDSFADYAQQDGTLTYQEMAKYNRLQKLEKELAGKIRKRTVAIAGHIRQGLRESFETAFERTRGAVGAEAGKQIRGVLKPETITKALQNPVSGLKLNRRLQVRRADIVLRIQEEVTQGLVRGESYRDMAARLKDELEGDLVKARKIVGTEGHRVQEQGKKESLDYAARQGVRMRKRWVSSRDERVRSSHQSMDGQEVAYEENFVNPKTGGEGPHPGAMGTAEDDINCRCIFTVVVVEK